MQLNNSYKRDDFLEFLENSFLGDFKRDIRSVNVNSSTTIKKASTLGRSENLDIQVFEFCLEGSLKKRMSLTKDAFSIMKATATFSALAVFYSPETEDWRLSLMTMNPEKTEQGKAVMSYSNPKRYSYLLGKNAKVNTPTKYLVSKGKTIDFNDLKARFSLEVVNKDFYKEISELFIKLVGGTLAKGKAKKEYPALIKLPYIEDKTKTSLEFAVRLIGRIIFCWFLREKYSDVGKSLMPKELLSFPAISVNKDYYHKILEPIFFEILNRPIKSRKEQYTEDSFSAIPYLNGGLFSPHDDDYYSSNEGKQAINHNIVVIPDSWFEEFFAVLETYNFTIDENISFDEELSIDPEMLGRIFENLLAEINPETGESARKSTGSYYTPRVVVDFMVDESIYSYLKDKTSVNEEKLRAIISYDLDDDSVAPVSTEEKVKIINALEEVKILDPACGSGAFPMGALQKIVFILQQIDPEGRSWFEKQLQGASPEIKRVIEREFANKSFDYIRKLGVIRKNIYGIDIQPIATEISRLRCFLTLIVDQGVYDELENRGIEPLPNLDFKFVTANSLIGLPDAQQSTLFGDKSGIDQLKDLREQFFNSTNSERQQLKLDFKNIQNQMLSKMLKMKGGDDLTQKLSTWDPFSHEPSGWFDSEWMFGIKEGFDIVIANPPYINIFNIKDKNFRDYLVNNYSVAKNKTDLYAFFTEKSVNILKENGKLAFIFSNSWMGTDSFSKFREFIINKTKVEKLVKCPSGVFEEATVTVVIIILTKKNVIDNDVDLLEFDGGKFKKIGFNLSYEFIKSQISNGFTFDKPLEIRIPHIKLGDVAKFSLGIKTSDDERFVLDSKKDEDSYKLLRGKDIGKYFIKFSDKWIWYKPELMNQRKGAGPRKIDNFLKTKILIKDVATEIQATLDTENYLTTDTISILHEIKGFDLNFILALLNSKLINKWFKLNFAAGLHIKTNQLENIPIPTDVNQNPFIEIVERVLDITKSIDYLTNIEKQGKVKEYQCQIDQMVYDLYNLTPEEIKIVEESNK